VSFSEKELDVMIALSHNAEPFVVVVDVSVRAFNIDNTGLFIESCFRDKFPGKSETTFIRSIYVLKINLIFKIKIINR
jgi:hypothetical protein